MTGNRESDRPSPEQLDGTLLKCPGCRLKFPFSASQQQLAEKKFPPIGGSSGEPRIVLVTHCPQCDGWVSIA